jgi:hypothetical protein
MKRQRQITAPPGQLVLPQIDPADIALADLAGDIQAESGYASVRALEDGTIIALGRLTFTTALYVDLTRTGWARRYCFKLAPLAVNAFDRLKSVEDVPAGWIAQRGG